MNETWKTVIDFSNYQISNKGRVINRKKGWYLHPAPNKKRRNYYYISLQQNGKRKNLLLSRLVAIHFIANPLNKTQVNHKNGDKSNNNVNNLEWVTPKENVAHAILNGFIAEPLRGSKQPRAIINEGNVINIRKLAKNGMYHRIIAKKYNIGVSTVTHIVNKTRWSWL